MSVAKLVRGKMLPAWDMGRAQIDDVAGLWENMAKYAYVTMPESKPLSFEEARLWLQSYNAGPYAVLRYKGTVPYRETRNYVPRVMKYYQEDLSNTPYEQYIVASAKKYGLDPQMIRAIMKTESDFRKQTVSSAGARGLMQVMPCVWSEIKKRYGIEWSYSKNVFEPEKNIEVACAYLAWLRYDFLPRHFAEFDPHPVSPTAVIRDRKPIDTASRIRTAPSGVSVQVAAKASAPRTTANRSL